jgi:hypothetical protein
MTVHNLWGRVRDDGDEGERERMSIGWWNDGGEGCGQEGTMCGRIACTLTHCVGVGGRALAVRQWLWY